MKRTTEGRVPGKYKLSSKARLIPKDQRHEVSPDAMQPWRTKVRVSIFLDLDVLEFFKELAGKPGAQPYQTQINAELRRIMDASKGGDVEGNLREAKGLIDAALRQIG